MEIILRGELTAASRRIVRLFLNQGNRGVKVEYTRTLNAYHFLATTLRIESDGMVSMDGFYRRCDLRDGERWQRLEHQTIDPEQGVTVSEATD